MRVKRNNAYGMVMFVTLTSAILVVYFGAKAIDNCELNEFQTSPEYTAYVKSKK